MSGLVSINYPLIIEPFRHAKNAGYPDADFYSQAHGALNHVLAYRGGEVFRRSNLLGFTRASGTNAVWRWRFRSGYGQTKLHCAGVLGLSSTSATDPGVLITIAESGGSTQTLTVYGGTTEATPSDSPSEWTPFEASFDINPASVYECSLSTIDYGGLLSFVARQQGDTDIDDATNYYSEHEPAGTHPIFDANQQRLIEGTGQLLRRNRGLQTNWCLYNGAARSTTSGTWTNIIDNSSTSPPTSTSPGYRFNSNYRNTASRATIPIEVAVYATATGSGDGHVTLRNTSGTDVAAVDVTGGLSAQWFTSDSTAYLDVGGGVKLDLGFYADATTTLNVYAIHIAEYEA